MSSLADEKERWEAGSETFKSQMSTISGDVLLTSAFMAYAGYFDQQFRHTLFSSWASHMQQANISFRPDLARVEVSPWKLLVFTMGGGGLLLCVHNNTVLIDENYH